MTTETITMQDEASQQLQRNVGLELTLGLASEDAELRLAPGSRCQDVQPWFLDVVAAKIECLGHHDEIPHPWDWENVLTSLEPGEELLYVIDHSADSVGRRGSFEVWVGIRFPCCDEVNAKVLSARVKRARALISQIRRRAFPGSELTWMEPRELFGKLTATRGIDERCVAVTGMPSPRSLNDDARDVDQEPATRNRQSLNDVVEPLFDAGCDYRIAFVVQRVSNNAISAELATKTTLYNQIHPMVEVSLRHGETWSEQQSENSSVSTAVTDSLGDQTSQAKGKTINAGPVAAVIGGVVGFGLGGPPGAAIGAAALGSLAGAISWNDSTTTGTTTGRSWGHTDTSGTSRSETTGTSSDETRLYVNSLLRLADGTLERTIHGLHETYGTGGFRWGTFVFANGQDADIASRSLMGVLAGSRTKDRPLVRFEIVGERERLLSSRTGTMDLIAEAAPILSLPRVRDALLVPAAELPGLRLRRNVFLGRNVDAAPDKFGLIELGPDAFSAVGTKASSAAIKLPGGDLFKHALVAGTTGSGKTTRVVEILNRLSIPDLSVVVFETAKCTYRTRLRRHGGLDPLVYSLGSSTEYGSSSRFRALRLNPFFFERGTSLKRHVAVLSDALAELMPTESMIGPLLRRAVETCYVERGWDIESGKPVGNQGPTWPTVIDFVVQARRLAAGLNYGPEVNANYRGALESRASLFLDATFQDIFGYGGNVPIDELFPAGRDAIIEVEDLPPSDVDVRAFVMTLLLSRLRSVQGSRSAIAAASDGHELAANRQWLVVVEEAHNVLDRQFEQRRPSDESNAGRTLLRTVVRLLQEGREMGIGMMVIDQMPSKLARDVIGNTGTKIVLRLEDADEMEEMGRAMGLDESAWKKLGFLQVGEALIKTSYMDQPAKSAAFSEPAKSGAPDEKSPSSEGQVPNFTALREHWQPILSGTCSELDDEWVDALLEKANGNPHLAVFGGLRTLLVDDPSDTKPDAPALRALLASATSDLPKGVILAEARECWRAIVAEVYSDQMARIATTLCHVLAPSPAWQVRAYSHDGIAVAAYALSKLDLGDAVKWEWILTQVHEDPASQTFLANLMQEDGGKDRTQAVRCLLSMTQGITRWGASSTPVPPYKLISSIRSTLRTMLLTDIEKTAESFALANALFTEVVEMLVRQVADRWGSAYAREVDEFMSTISRFHQ